MGAAEAALFDMNIGDRDKGGGIGRTSWKSKFMNEF